MDEIALTFALFTRDFRNQICNSGRTERIVVLKELDEQFDVYHLVADA